MIKQGPGILWDLVTIGYVTWYSGGFSWWHDFRSPELSSALRWREVKNFSLNHFDQVTAASAIFYGCAWWMATATSDQVVISDISA